MTLKSLAIVLLTGVMVVGAIMFLTPSVKKYDAKQNREHRFDTISQAINQCQSEGLSSVVDTDACEFHCSASWSLKISFPLCLELNVEKDHQ